MCIFSSVTPLFAVVAKFCLVVAFSSEMVFETAVGAKFAFTLMRTEPIAIAALPRADVYLGKQANLGVRFFVVVRNYSVGGPKELNECLGVYFEKDVTAFVWLLFALSEVVDHILRAKYVPNGFKKSVSLYVAADSVYNNASWFALIVAVLWCSQEQFPV